MTAMIHTEEVVRDDGRTCKLTRKCDLCATDVSMFVQPGDFEKYLAGYSYIQNLFPYLTADERELLLNGFCGPCFDSFCPPEED
jgi:hypothetical protein